MKQIRIETIRVKRVPDDDDPDLSYLESPADKQRRDDYGNTWHMLGIYAEARVGYFVDEQKKGQRLEWFKSAGVWGIESDSDDSHFEEIEREELADLKSHLQAFNVDVSDFEKKVNQ